MSNRVLLAIPTAPQLDYGEYEIDWDKKYGRNEWDRANRRWHRVYGRFNGPGLERQEAVRETWWKHQAPATCKFFMGQDAVGQEWPEDVVVLPGVSDKYLFGLQEKIVGAAKWALENDFDVMVKLDDDTFVYPNFVPLLLETTLDWGGYIYQGSGGTPCVSGGCGEIFGKKALEAAAKADLSLYPEYRHWEDRWFGELMKQAGLTAVNVPGMFDEPHLSAPKMMTMHPCSPVGLRQAYEEIYLSQK